jgi:thiamine-monophosphate kinase
MAAMGGVPAWMLLGLTLPAADPRWLQDFADGLYAAANEHDVALIGGDTTRGPLTVVTVQLTGHIRPETFLTRSGSKAGDLIFVSGTPGDAAAGLALLQNGARERDEYLLQRFRSPQARVALGQELTAVASAAIDISDGLYADLDRLLRASGVSGAIELDLLPLSPQLLRHCDRRQATSFALTGGDDYELCFTVPPRNERQLVESTEALDAAITCIGHVGEGQGLSCTINGAPVRFESTGYRHF